MPWTRNALSRRLEMDGTAPESPGLTPGELRRRLAPEIDGAFREFGKRVFADGALPADTKELIAVAVAHVTQCPYCIRGHTLAARRRGVTADEIMEAIWVAAEMRAGAAFAHSTIALEALQHT
jgi:AhpD family alkylhydroperoxidase